MYFGPMPSDADAFEATLESFEEFVDDGGRHFYIVKFEDDSGRVFRKQPSANAHSLAEFVLRDRYTKAAMRSIGAATEFEFDDDTNTQQNLRNLFPE
jgi:hypothetical protein